MQACVEHGTHYCDLTDEPHFIRDSIERYHSKARAHHTKIIHCCGFDSVPSDVLALVAADYLKTKHGLAVDKSEFVVIEGVYCRPWLSREVPAVNGRSCM